METIRKNVLTLPAGERAMLAHELIVSLDDPSGNELSPHQEAETRRRVQMVRKSKVSGRPAEQVFIDIEAKHR